MKYFKMIFFLMGLSILFANKVLAWDKDVVHPLLNKKAAEQSSLNSYLTTYLQSEFPDGTEQAVTWIEEGGREEDESILPLIGYLTRSSKHFHDPTKNWDNAGWLGASQSSVYWAQSSSNEWSWQKARQYYLDALTGSTKTERKNKYENTFKALGHVMHLVADLAVPEHTRNDTHVISKTIEGWAQNHAGELNTSATTVNASIFQQSLVSGLVPIINLWDTYPYVGYNPNGPIGLAEYSNYNFLSHDTVFKDYKFPGRTNTFLGEPSIHIAEDGTNDNLIYYNGKTSDGIPIPHLAFTTYLFSEISQKTQDEFNNLNATLDDRCFKDYASILVPKAAGYSAGLLNYFFRGQIDMEKDPNNGSQYVIKNGSDEDMDGVFTLCYDDANENRKCFANWGLQIGAGGSKSVSFTAPTSPEPKEKGKYILVFQGILGNESGAVVGKMVKLCGGSATITISGSDAPQNGSQYTATGGESPYTWTISKGSITKDGVVTVSGQCGVATITVKDSCGNQTTKDVRMSNGVWVRTSVEGYSSNPSYSFSGETLFQRIYWWASAESCCGYYPPTCNLGPPSGIRMTDTELIMAGFGNKEEWPSFWGVGCSYSSHMCCRNGYWDKRVIYEWRCP